MKVFYENEMLISDWVSVTPFDIIIKEIEK